MPEDNLGKRSLTWDDIASPLWRSGSSRVPIWVSGHLIMMADRNKISPEPLIIDFGYAKAIAFYGEVPYVKLSEFIPKSSEVPVFGTKVEEVISDEGAYLLLVFPFDASEPNRSEGEIRVKIQELVGILVAVFGPNVAYHRVFDNVILPDENKRTAFGKSFRTPTTLPVPDLSDRKIQIALNVVENLGNIPEMEANRVRLSLRWFSEAHYADGVDNFLKLWFAIEALGMEDRKNLRPIIQTLADAYQISYSDAKIKFAIGRLFGFRSKIVHQGELPSIHALLSDYVAAIYQDLLYKKLNLESQGFASAIQEDPNFDLEKFISSTHAP